ncbi:MAG: hypothetical protein JKY08_08955 [Flavobacteriaceae bacterium]|nr:hypothetical protein [Flavobacteriaceae bacterium]
MGYTIEGLWTDKHYEKNTKEEITFSIPSHAVVVLKITGTSDVFNPFQRVK